MFDKHFKTLEINKSIPTISGKKIYYDRMTLWITIIAQVLMVILSIVTYSFDKELYFLLIIPLVLVFVPDTIRKLRTEFPVFIIQKDKFYYTLNNQWFDKTNCNVNYKTKVGGFPNISGTLVISDKNGWTIVEENIFYLDDAVEFRKEIENYTTDINFL
jgi:hypothetical protein